jgi:hypothetical protein
MNQDRVWARKRQDERHGDSSGGASGTALSGRTRVRLGSRHVRWSRVGFAIFSVRPAVLRLIVPMTGANSRYLGQTR